VAGRYARTTKRCKKGALIDEVVANTEYHRKAVIRLMRWPPREKKEKARRERAARYGKAEEEAMIVVWRAMDYACGVLTHAGLGEMVGILKRHGHLKMTGKTEQLLRRMSRSTIERIIKRYRHLRPAGRYTPRRPGQAALARSVPIEVLPEPAMEAGMVDSDTVQHDGGDIRGTFVITANFIDRSTFWSCKRVIYGKGQAEMRRAVIDACARMPMAWRRLHFDGGSEYINAMVLSYCQAQGIEYTKGRPYCSNDNARVENRNRYQVRRRVGRMRIDDRRRADVLQRIWELDDLHHNYFHPVGKLMKTSTTVVNGIRHRVKEYDGPRTPYARVIADLAIPAAAKRALKAERLRLDPLELLAQMQRLIRTL
jgi:hypothetical protein